MLKECSKKDSVDILYTNLTEAEAIKLFANSYLALRVAYFNELDTYAEMNNLNSAQIIEGVCLDPRIGQHYNNPSFGYGGYCLPKDSKQLLANFTDVPENLIQAIVDSNETRKKYITNHIVEELLLRCGKKEKYVVGIYKLAMKSGSDNFRQSSIRDIMEYLCQHPIEIIIYEPTISENKFEGYNVNNDFESFANMSDIIITNRYNSQLESMKSKVYTRDIFERD